MLPVMVGFVIAGIAVVGRESGLARRSADFTIAYSAALLIREGRAEDVYRPDQLGPLMLRLSDSAIDPRLPFDAPLAESSRHKDAAKSFQMLFRAIPLDVLGINFLDFHKLGIM